MKFNRRVNRREMPKTLYAKVMRLHGGFDDEQEFIRQNYKIGDVFKVTAVDMGKWHTDIYEGDKVYNSIYFDFFLDAECTQPHDIYEDPYFNPYLRRRT